MEAKVLAKECPECRARMVSVSSGPFMCDKCDHVEDFEDTMFPPIRRSTMSLPCPYKLGWIILCTGLTIGSCKLCPIHKALGRV